MALGDTEVDGRIAIQHREAGLGFHLLTIIAKIHNVIDSIYKLAVSISTISFSVSGA